MIRQSQTIDTKNPNTQNPHHEIIRFILYQYSTTQHKLSIEMDRRR